MSMEPEEHDLPPGLRRLWRALDLVGIGRTALGTFVIVLSPWRWWRTFKGTWTEVDLTRVAKESGSGIQTVFSPMRWGRIVLDFWHWLEIKRLGKGIAVMPVSGARAGADIMGTILRTSRPVLLVSVPIAFILWLVMGGGGHTDPRLKVAGLPLHPVQEKGNSELTKLLKILDERPDSASLHAKAARAYLASGSYSNASKEFHDAIRIDQKNADAISGMQDIAIRVQDVAASLQIAKQASKLRPEDPEMANRLGSSYARAGQFAEAIEEFDRALKIQPNNIVFLLNNAAAHAQLKRWDQALALCGKAISLKPNEELPYLLLADIMIRRGSIAQAISVLERLTSEHPKSAFAFQALGSALMEDGKLSEALRSYAAAQLLSPQWPLPYLGAGIANLKANEISGAERCFRTVLKLRPDSVTAQLGMAGIFERKLRPTDAIKIYRDVLSTQPNLLMPLNNLAYHLAEQGTNLGEAYALAQQAAQNFPAEKSVWDTLGFTCYRSGKIPEALTYLNRAVKMSPLNPITHYHLAKALSLSGDRGAGIKSMQQALALGLPDPLRADGLTFLKQAPPG